MHENIWGMSCNGITWHRRIRFDGAAPPHPVAQMLLTELGREARGWQGV